MVISRVFLFKYTFEAEKLEFCNIEKIKTRPNFTVFPPITTQIYKNPTLADKFFYIDQNPSRAFH